MTFLRITTGSKSECEAYVRKLRREENKLRKLGTGNYAAIEIRLVFDGPHKKEYGVFVLPASIG